MKRVKRNLQASKAAARDRALQRYRKRYERFKSKLLDLGYICRGSITCQWLTCGKPACVCHRDPAKRHGPYYYWTRRAGGRTESRMLDEPLKRLYKEGICNHRKLDTLIERMQEISLVAFKAAKMASNR